MEKLEEYGVYEMDAREVLMFNGGGQQIPPWLINSDSAAEAGSAIRHATAYVAGFVVGFLEHVL